MAKYYKSITMTRINEFIFWNVNRDKSENHIPFTQISNSIAQVWVNIWNGMTTFERENYKNKNYEKLQN